MCSTHNRPDLNTGVAVASEMDGWKGIGRHEEEQKGSDGGGVGTAGTSGDWANGAESAAAVDDRSGALIAKRAGDWVRPADGTVVGFENDAAADDGLAISGSGGGLVSAAGDLVIVEPDGKLVTEEPVDDLEMTVLCGSSSEKGKVADVLANGSRVSVNEGGGLESAAGKVAFADLATVFAANFGYALSESGPCLTWPSLCWICSY